MKDLTLRWIGNAGWIIELNGIRLMVDPDIEPSGERISLEGIDFADFAADVVLITHEHGDHFNRYTAEYLLKNTCCLFVLPASCLCVAQKIGIPDSRIIHAQHFMSIAPFGEGLTITPQPALHGAPHGAVYKYANFMDCGYLISGEKTLFIPGDTVLLEAHYELCKVDILMISPTEHNTNVAQSLKLIDRLSPEYIFPQHRDTYRETPENYFWTHGYTSELKTTLPAEYKNRYCILKQGEKIIVPRA